MKHHLRQEIENLIKLLNRKRAELTDAHLHESLRNIYELSVLLQHQQSLPQQSELGKKQQALFDSLATASIVKEADIPTTTDDTHEEVPKLMDTIKNMVTEMPESQEVNALFTQIEEPNFVRKGSDKTQAKPEKTKATADEKTTPNLNERFNTGLKVDLNDRLAFIQHLFNNSPNEYQRAMNQLTTFDSMEQAEAFIQELIKPDYQGWEGKEEYEDRFSRVLNQYFETK